MLSRSWPAAKGAAILTTGTQKERVLLLNPPGTRYYARDKYCSSISVGNYYWPQIDLLVLSGRLKDRYAVTLLDAIVTCRRPSDLLSHLEAENFRAVIFLASLASFREDLAFIQALKERCPRTEMIGNGGLLLVQGEQILKENPCLDAVLLDFTTEHILDYLDGHRPVPDMITRTKNGIVRGDRRADRSFSYPLPLHEQLPRGRYLMPIAAAPRFTVSITSTGCRFGCIFCIANKNPFRLRDPENAIEELRAIECAGFSHVLYHDINFVSDRDYVARFCESILAGGIKIQWAFQTRVDAVDGEILSLVRRAGCRAIEYGVESGDNRVLKKMNKGISVEQVHRAFRMTRERGIRSVGFFLIGMPGETEETVRKTIDLAVDIDCDYASFSLPLPHPGTKLADSLEGGAAEPADCTLFGGAAESALPPPPLEPEEARALRRMAYRRFYLRPSYIWKRLRGTASWYELWLQFRIFIGILESLLAGGREQRPPSPAVTVARGALRGGK